MEPEADSAMSLKNIKTESLRFYMDYEADRNAWEKLKTLSRRYHLSFNQIIILALNAADMDNFPSCGSADDRLAQKISEQVAVILRQSSTMPSMQAQPVPASNVPDVQPAAEDDPPPDFSGSHVDWSFIG